MKTTSNIPLTLAHVSSPPCSACGLLCDDIEILSTDPVVIKNGCAKSHTFFNHAFSSSDPETENPRINGNVCDLDSAIEATVKIIRQSKQLFIGGLGTEVQGMRTIMQLADKTGATLDHMHNDGAFKNLLVLQNSGWQNTTLTEIKNRADLILCLGTDIVSTHPRFFERLVWNSNSMFNKVSPEVIYLGVPEDSAKAGISPNGKQPLIIPANINKFPEIITALNALLNNNHLREDSIAGVPYKSLQLILNKLRAATYAVVVWSAGNLKFTHAELTIQSITQFITKLNEENRVTGLPLNGGDGDMSVNNTCTWLRGYPTRSRYNGSNLKSNCIYDPYHFSSEKLLENCDALIWVSTFSPLPAPKTDVPKIVIGHKNIKFDHPPEIYIPVGIPGIDHSGSIFRMDNVVALPLKKLRENNLPNLSQVIHLIMDKL